MDRTADYEFELPAGRIAQVPADRRDHSRLLVVGDALTDAAFFELGQFLPRDAVLVVNDARVRRARVAVSKRTGGTVELLFIEPGAQPGRWRCLARSSKPMRPGAELLIGERVVATVASDRGHDSALDIDVHGQLDDLLATHGQVPLPPYIERAHGATEADGSRYQTVYADRAVAAAAPTAGLHFTPELLAALGDAGVSIATITLHVGWGTFAPMRGERIADHVMHAETYDVPARTAQLCESGRPVVAVGTTVVRAVEAAAIADRSVAPGSGRTDLFIRPGYHFRVVDHLITNFHLPRSSLLVLVSAFAGRARVRAAYDHAIASGYRFFSYGDAMLLSRAC